MLRWSLAEHLPGVSRNASTMTSSVLWPTTGMGFALFFRGDFVPARAHYRAGMALYDSQQHHDRALLGVHDFVVMCLTYLAWILAILGYPDQAVSHIDVALTRARELAHPYSLVYALGPCRSYP